jgi:2-polyprenyl-3-methyl-5-hydroxy-6-metoxy-1,4-benzoquinol methylase
MNYEEQKKYFDRGRWFSLFAVIAILFFGYFALLRWRDRVPVSVIAVCICLLIGTMAALAYLPDYIHLSVERNKAVRWAVMVRWRIAAGALVALLAATPITLIRVLLIVCCVAWLVVAAVVAKKWIPPKHALVWLWTTDISLIAVLLIRFGIPRVLATMLFLFAATLMLAAIKPPLWWFVTSFLSSGLILLASPGIPMNPDPAPETALIWVTGALAYGLVSRARRQDGKNVSDAISELMHFTGRLPHEIGNLWATSNQQLARNWENAKLDETNAEKMAAWYRDNSELYMFAISAYNLEYKRIKSNLAMMKYGRGKCLDYGAGNGELILEMARRGHPAVYYDVEGTSMLFARSRAEQRQLNVEFCTTKDCLRESAARKAFDTIFSFDVLEHIPDLAGELDFLASLLAPGGLMVFDVPAGSTKAHPMHLNHNLDVRAHMLAKGMTEEKLGQSFRKQEKYLFRKTA